MSVEGIDVAEFSLNIDWEKVKQNGIHFAYARVNDGTTHMDNRFPFYWNAIKEVEIIRGAYFFFRPSQDIDTQVRLFAQAFDIEAGDLPPVVDLESAPSWDDWNVAGSIDRVAKCLTSVELACGCKPIIYTGPSFWREQMGNTPRFADYDLWIANYGTDTPDIPGGWKFYTFHQYQGDQEGFPGIEGNVDRNRFNGSLDRLQAEALTAIPLKEGRIGPKVKRLQQTLKKLAKNLNHPEFDPGFIDGIFGSATKEAVIAYQKANNIQPNGIVFPDDKVLF